MSQKMQACNVSAKVQSVNREEDDVAGACIRDKRIKFNHRRYERGYDRHDRQKSDEGEHGKSSTSDITDGCQKETSIGGDDHVTARFFDMQSKRKNLVLISRSRSRTPPQNKGSRRRHIFN